MHFEFVITGLLVGFLIGLTGMGGGALMTPILILLLGVKPTMAVGSDLTYAAITKVIGALQHGRQGTVNHGLAWRLAIGSVPGSLLGVAWVHHLQHTLGESVQGVIARPLGVMLILVSIALLWQASVRAAGWKARFTLNLREPARWIGMVAAGLVLGFLVGVTSVGSGTLFGVLLVLCGLSAREMVGTDIYHGAILTAAAAAAHVWVGNVDSHLVAVLLMGSIPGVLIGSRLAVRLPDRALRPILAGVLLFSGLRMI